jgi:hypothetical protein
MIVKGGGCVRGGYEADDVATSSRMRPAKRDWSEIWRYEVIALLS